MYEVVQLVSIGVLTSVITVTIVVGFILLVDAVHKLPIKKLRTSNVLFEDHQKIVTVAIESHLEFDIPVIEMRSKYSGKVERFHLVREQE